jgi:hypothetical protein
MKSTTFFSFPIYYISIISYHSLSKILKKHSYSYLINKSHLSILTSISTYFLNSFVIFSSHFNLLIISSQITFQNPQKSPSQLITHLINSKLIIFHFPISITSNKNFQRLNNLSYQTSIVLHS